MWIARLRRETGDGFPAKGTAFREGDRPRWLDEMDERLVEGRRAGG